MRCLQPAMNHHLSAAQFATRFVYIVFVIVLIQSAVAFDMGRLSELRWTAPEIVKTQRDITDLVRAILDTKYSTNNALISPILG